MIVLSDLIREISNAFQSPKYLLLVIFLIPVLIFLLKHDFVHAQEDPKTAKNKKKARKVVFITRLLIIILLLVALAGPVRITEKTIKGDAFIKMLTDKSNSMDLFQDRSLELKEKLEKKVNVEADDVGIGDVTNIGDSILNSLEPGGSILLISDGNANSGADLGDVALYASKINASINAINIKPIYSDVGVSVTGPSKTMAGIDNTFTVRINKAGNIDTVYLSVTINGESVFDDSTSKSVIEFTKDFGKGNHRIIAEINAEGDYFPQNNIFYKTVRVVSQPEILFLSKKTQSPLKTLLDDLYKVSEKTTLPASLDDYYALVVNDIPANDLNHITSQINEFISDGNGMVVVGGSNSYQHGNYQGSSFESLLPVFIGSPGKKAGGVNVALVLDISPSTGAYFGSSKAVDVEKALAVNVVNDLSPNSILTVIVFSDATKVISPPSYVFEKTGLEDLIGSLRDSGTSTRIEMGLKQAIDILSPLSGSKNIILISDGWTYQDSLTEQAALLAAQKGIKIYTVGVGPSTNFLLMMKVAAFTNGIYFKATEESKLKLLFGSPEDKEAMGKKMTFTILDINHFITQNLAISADLSGFNMITPKSTARLLATTSGGDPVLAISRLGLGRVVALGVDDGSKWAGQLLNKDNSKIISRMMNWAIGDPERKSKAFIEAKDTRINDPTEIIVRAETRPTATGVTFQKIDEDTYSASVTPTQTGFQETGGALFAVNYPAEYDSPGFSKELNLIVKGTGGHLYSYDDVDEIVKNAKTKSKRTITAKEPVIAPFVLLAIIIYLLEIFIRRFLRKE